MASSNPLFKLLEGQGAGVSVEQLLGMLSGNEGKPDDEKGNDKAADLEATTRRQIEATAKYVEAMSAINMSMSNPLRAIIVPEIIETFKLQPGDETRVRLFPKIPGRQLAQVIHGVLFKHAAADFDVTARFFPLVTIIGSVDFIDLAKLINIMGDVDAMGRYAETLIKAADADNNQLRTRLQFIATVCREATLACHAAFKEAALKQLEAEKKKAEPRKEETDEKTTMDVDTNPAPSKKAK
jgi:hypothetical protein